MLTRPLCLEGCSCRLHRSAENSAPHKLVLHGTLYQRSLSPSGFSASSIPSRHNNEAICFVQSEGHRGEFGPLHREGQHGGLGPQPPGCSNRDFFLICPQPMAKCKARIETSHFRFRCESGNGTVEYSDDGFCNGQQRFTQAIVGPSLSVRSRLSRAIKTPG